MPEENETEFEFTETPKDGETQSEATEVTDSTKEVNQEDITFEDVEDMNDEDIEGKWGKPDDTEEEVKEPVEEPKEESKEEVVAPETTPAKEVPPEVEQVLKMLGDDAMLKVKGQDYKVSDLAPEEVTAYLQKGMAFHQGSEENARERDELARARQVLEQDVAMVRNVINQNQGQGQRPGAPVRDNAPDFLRESEFDTESERNLKTFSQNLLGRLDNIESTTQQTAAGNARQNVLNEIMSLQTDYPGASVDEVIAIKAHYPHIPADKLMEKSHEHYTSKTHIDQVLKASPDLLRELDEEAIVRYKARQAKANAVPGKKSATSGGKGVSTQKPKRILDFDDADSASLDYLKELERSSEE